MKVLVTGGAGYIGGTAVRSLPAAGHMAYVVDNLRSGYRSRVPGSVPFAELDILDTEALAALLRDWSIDAVMHFAGVISVGESVREPLLYHTQNTAGTISVLRAMQQTGVKRLIYSGTAAAYGEGPPEGHAIPEAFPPHPINPYGWSKVNSERVIADLCSAGQLQAIVLRYFNVAGACSDGSHGECHRAKEHLIERLLLCTLGVLEGNFAIFGDDYPTPDGTCIRDYVHVEDLIDAHILALGALADERRLPIFNVGSSEGYSVLQVVQAVQEVTGTRLEVPVEDRRPGDPARLVACSDLIRRRLGWQPRFGLRDMVASAFEWHKQVVAGEIQL